MDRPEIKIGDTYYTFDINRRVYKDGNLGPDFRSHFVPQKVVGETTRSWLIGHLSFPRKVPKKDPWGILRTEAMIDDEVWRHNHVYLIAEAVKRQRPNVLRKVAEIVGYDRY